MTPSAAPMIRMFAGVTRRRRKQQVPYVTQVVPYPDKQYPPDPKAA
jgi:predicted metal-binding membrane protein